MTTGVLLFDAHLPPSLCAWVEATFHVRCQHVRQVGLHESDDGFIIEYARRTAATILTKDGDLSARPQLTQPPPWIILLARGNTTNERLRAILERSLPGALSLLDSDTPVVVLAVS